MNIAIFGDSFANGVTDGLRGNRHGGLVDYLKEDGILWLIFQDKVIVITKQ